MRLRAELCTEPTVGSAKARGDKKKFWQLSHANMTQS